MGLVIDKLTGEIYLFDFTGGGTGTTSGSTYPEVNLFTDLPLPSTVPTKIYVVRSPSGTFMINRKEAGLYYSNGVVWRRLGDTPSFFNDDNFEIYDGDDNTKRVKFQLSGLTTSTLRTLTLQNASGTLAFLSDIASKLNTTTFTGYTASTKTEQIILISTGVTDINQVTPTSIAFHVQKRYDTTHFLFTGGTNIRILTSGIYEISYHINVVSTTASAKSIASNIFVNGTINNNTLASTHLQNNTSLSSISLPSLEVTLVANDLITLRGYRILNAGAANTVPNSVFISIRKKV